MRSNDRRLLLLNTTNHPVRLAYPYAFVQVSEVARRHGIETRRFDMYGVRRPNWPVVLRQQLEQYRPTLIGITLRNTDSLLSTDYLRRQEDGRYAEPFSRNLLERLTIAAPPYFPTHETKALVEVVRSLTDHPIILGGFGFSAQPTVLMEYLTPDFGVIGDAEPVFARYDDLMSRRSLNTIDNLCYFESGQLHSNTVVYVGPTQHREYNDEILDDRKRFFGAALASLPATSRSIPVEVMRGCPYRCTFCSEPNAKGKRVQFRELDVIADELEFLRSHSQNLIWFVCSEINAMGSEFALNLAERLIHINERRPASEQVRWLTYYLLRFTREELRVLRRSGFLGGWNDIPAFEDKTLRKLRVPYRTKQLVNSLKDIIAIGEEEAAARGTPQRTLEQRVFFDPDHRETMLPDDLLTSPVLTLFLGNQFTDVDSVRESLRVMDAEGLAARYDATVIIRSERVFGYNAVDETPMISVEPGGRMDGAIDFVNPTFAFPPALMKHFGSRSAYERFFIHVEDTFLSKNHLFRKDWCWFLGTTLTLSDFHALWLDTARRGFELGDFTSVAPAHDLLQHLIAEPSEDNISVLFQPPPGRRPLASCAADAAVRAVLAADLDASRRVFEFLGVPHDSVGRATLTEYQLTSHLFKRWERNADVLQQAQQALNIHRASREWLALKDLLYRANVELSPEYRVFFVQPQPELAAASLAG